MKHFILILSFIVIPNMMGQSILGIDVSHHQGSINWTMVANDAKVFAYCKATEGMTYQDPNFATYMVQGIAAGVVMGAYHFARPDNNTAIQDADNFISHAQNYIGDGFLPPVLDLEDPNSSTHLDNIYTSNQLTNWVQAWFDRVESQTGVRPIIYSNSNYANYLNSSLNTYGLWIAKPGTSATTPPTNMGVWNDWMFKQYSWYGSVNGISGNVDLDVYHGTIDDFNAMIHPTAIHQISKNNLRIFPNPVRNQLHIDNKISISIVNLSIFDTNARLIRQITPEAKIIDVSQLQKGFYILKVYFENGQTSFIKFIKE